MVNVSLKEWILKISNIGMGIQTKETNEPNCTTNEYCIIKKEYRKELT